MARVDSKSRAAIVEKDVTLMCGELDWNVMVSELVTMLLLKITSWKSDISGGISNLYMCKGERGKVIEVEASGRKGEQASLTQVKDFVSITVSLYFP